MLIVSWWSIPFLSQTVKYRSPPTRVRPLRPGGASSPGWSPGSGNSPTGVTVTTPNAARARPARATRQMKLTMFFVKAPPLYHNSPPKARKLKTC